MFSAGRKPQFNTVCSWLFQESPKNFNLPLPQLKCSPLTLIQWGLKHGPAVPIQPVLVHCVGSFKVRKTGDDECRFHFLMSTGRFQVCGFLSSKARTVWKSQIGVCFTGKEFRDFQPLFVSVTQQFLMWKKTDRHINATTVRPSWSLLLA